MLGHTESYLNVCSCKITPKWKKTTLIHKNDNSLKDAQDLPHPSFQARVQPPSFPSAW